MIKPLIKVVTVTLIIIYKLLLDYTYKNFVSVIYAYEFSYIDQRFRTIEAYIITIIMALLLMWLFKKSSKPSVLIVSILFLNILIPILSYYSMTDSPRAFIYLATLSVLLIAAMSRVNLYIPSPKVKSGGTWLAIISFFLCTYVVFNLIAGGALSRLNFDLLNVYDVREGYLSNLGPYMGYFLPWVAYSVNMVLITLFLDKKKYFALFLVLAFQLFIFASTGFKSFLFAIGLVILIFYGLRKKRNLNFMLLLSLIYCFTISSVYLIYTSTGDIVPASILIRRNFFSPAQINFLYYDFFSNMPFVKWSNSVFSRFIDNPYGNTLPITNVISDYFYGRHFGLNVGYIGDAFMHLGTFGVAIVSIIFGLLVKFVDGIAKTVPMEIIIGCLVIPAMAFVNSGFLTTLLTHGFLVSVFLLILLKSNYDRNDPV